MVSESPGQLLFVGFEGASVPGDVADLVRAGRVGGVVLFGRNLPNEADACALVDELHHLAPAERPLTLCIDQEGGRVQRLPSPWTRWPAMQRIGERARPEDAAALGSAMGRELAELGVDVDFAPCVDLAPEHGAGVIGDRSFGSDPERVAALAVAFVRGLQAAGVAGCAKHFPGHGRTGVDSHDRLPVLDVPLETLRTSDWIPFRACIEAGVRAVMVGHLAIAGVDDERPATLSPVTARHLRQVLGFAGVVVSDDLDMGAVAGSHTPAEIVAGGLRAGLDVFLACKDPELRAGVLEALEGSAPSALRGPLTRLRSLKRHYAGGRRRSRRPVSYPEHAALCRALARA